MAAQQHGSSVIMLPVEHSYCHIPPGSGEITAVVLWDRRDGAMADEVYAPTDRDRRALPTLGPNLGNEIARMETGGELVEFAPVVWNLDGCYRVDDRRTKGPGVSYMVWFGRHRGGNQARPAPKTVYRFFNESQGDWPHRCRSTPSGR